MKSREKMSYARWSYTNSYVFKCPNCDYQKEFSQDYNEKRMERLHNKVCKNTGRTTEGQLTNKTTNMKKLTIKASKKNGWEMMAEGGTCQKIEPTHTEIIRVAKRMAYEKLVNEYPYMSDEEKKELLKKNDKHISAVLDNFGINFNLKMMN